MGSQAPPTPPDFPVIRLLSVYLECSLGRAIPERRRFCNLTLPAAQEPRAIPPFFEFFFLCPTESVADAREHL